ncbi:MAG: hypothetical protein GTO02_14415 [Candidatus Dadabacteria bacterium]|nr:hypothetical protein [Candidatus Dadabacteria bacterium]NIQ15539.1 hypothetical protein [Candidatus Dadabacteria bacterium]
MSKNGFQAETKITAVEIRSGFFYNNFESDAIIEMEGIVREDNYYSYSYRKDKKDTLTYIKIEFSSENDFSEYPKYENINYIGILSTKYDEHRFFADIDVKLSLDMLEPLIVFKDHKIMIEPVFLQDPTTKEKYIEESENNYINRYIERIYFIPSIEYEDF